MTIIAIEEHWNSVNIRDALDRLQGGARDESVAFNTMGDNQARLEDIGQGRVEAMDAAGIDVSTATPIFSSSSVTGVRCCCSGWTGPTASPGSRSTSNARSLITR